MKLDNLFSFKGGQLVICIIKLQQERGSFWKPNKETMHGSLASPPLYTTDKVRV